MTREVRTVVFDRDLKFDTIDSKVLCRSFPTIFMTIMS